jgi:hypothetical protein
MVKAVLSVRIRIHVVRWIRIRTQRAKAYKREEMSSFELLNVLF